MNNDIPKMEVDLGHARDRDSYAFDETFVVAVTDNESLECRVDVTAALTKSGSRYVLECVVAGVMRAECHRCLEVFDHALQAGFTLVLQRGAAAVPEGMVEEDFIILTEGQECRFDIFPRVREAVVLELPIRFLCREDCAGICAGCGKNLNTESCACAAGDGDSRWGPLKKLLNGADGQ